MNIKKILSAVCIASAALCLGACTPEEEPQAVGEVAGRYEMIKISGTIGNAEVDASYYKYFRIDLEDDGSGRVSAAYNIPTLKPYVSEGTYTYADGVISFTVSDGGSSVTEAYAYDDGVISYESHSSGMDISATFTSDPVRLAELDVRGTYTMTYLRGTIYNSAGPDTILRLSDYDFGYVLLGPERSFTFVLRPCDSPVQTIKGVYCYSGGKTLKIRTFTGNTLSVPSTVDYPEPGVISFALVGDSINIDMTFATDAALAG